MENLSMTKRELLKQLENVNDNASICVFNSKLGFFDDDLKITKCEETVFIEFVYN